MYNDTFHKREFLTADLFRVEKYRPSSLDDVQGHQDILATINKFIDTHVSLPLIIALYRWKHSKHKPLPAFTTSSSLWSTRYRKNDDDSGPGETDIWKQKYAANGAGVERF